ncbi:hypothetical protein E1286_04875 [Nonomuraea terrae]|uniref:Core-binding (CB) domain-containing protein n=1 Tax=Nonomuraea terrae TaxID=2530383 RepID=A0A4V2YNJ9_9ACTN|nr:hypothetical protein [Nonomuraea terrae]TDD54527.1 hypothetical protein E1286_04875 [Nonomuraea terrae]
MAFHQVRKDSVIVARWKRADGSYGTKSRHPDTGEYWADAEEAESWGNWMEDLEQRGLAPDYRKRKQQPEPEAADEDEVTVDQWFARWWPGIDLSLKGRNNYAYIFRAHVLPEWGHWPLSAIKASDVNAWEQRMIQAEYSRTGVAQSARTRLTTLLGDAVTEGLIGSNPALRQRHRGRRSGAGTAGRGQEKKAISPFHALVTAERMGVMSGRDDEFIFGVTVAWCALRDGEAFGLQRSDVKFGKIRLDWQLLEEVGEFYRLPPKDDSNRDIDLPPFLQDLLNRQIAAHPDRQCACKPRTIPGQEEQPCQGGPYIFLGERGAHPRRSNFSRRVFQPAVDGWYPDAKGKRRAGDPVLVAVDSTWPGAPVPSWPKAVKGEPWEPRPVRGYQRRPLHLGVNAASSKNDLVAFAVRQGMTERDARQLTREQILARFIRPVPADASVATWLPVEKGLTLHELGRHTHSTWLMDLSCPLQLRDDRMGHASPDMRGMRERYSHVTPESRVWLRGELERLWDGALARRAWFDLHSPVKVLDELLTPFRDGRREPIAPYERRGEVLEFPAATVG